MIFRDTNILNSIRSDISDKMHAEISTYSSLSIIGNVENNMNEDMENLDDIMFSDYFICNESRCGSRNINIGGKCV